MPPKLACVAALPPSCWMSDPWLDGYRQRGLSEATSLWLGSNLVANGRGAFCHARSCIPPEQTVDMASQTWNKLTMHCWLLNSRKAPGSWTGAGGAEGVVAASAEGGAGATVLPAGAAAAVQTTGLCAVPGAAALQAVAIKRSSLWRATAGSVEYDCCRRLTGAGQEEAAWPRAWVE